ncbi:MAG: CsbD family protein [Candidatus Acidiferrales bacterium]
MIKRSTKDKGEGAFRELKGKVKQKVGQLTNDRALEAKGLGEKMSGKMQKKIGDLERVIEKS